MLSFSRQLESPQRFAPEREQVGRRSVEQTQIDQPAFEAAARRFMDVFLNILAARRHSSQHLEEQHFNLTDWEEVAGVTTDSQAAERALFQTVCAVAPPGLSPEDFQVGPPPA